MENVKNTEPSQEDTRIGAILDIQNRINKSLWVKKGIVRLCEIVGFTAMFLFGHITLVLWVAVIITGIAMAFDFYLNYCEYRDRNEFAGIFVQG